MTTRYTAAFVGPGDVLDLPAPYARDAGSAAKIGALFGVARNTLANAEVGPFDMRGQFDLAKLSTDVWAIGDRLYWDDTNKRLDLDSTVGMFVAVATEVTANPSSTGQCILCPPSELLEGGQTHIADVATADGSDATTTQALANALKAKMNVILAELRIARVLKSS